MAVRTAATLLSIQFLKELKQSNIKALKLSWCFWRCGPTLTHPELSRETQLRRR